MLSYLTFSATQGGADAFVQTSTSTGLDQNTGLAFLIREIIVEVPRTGSVAAGNIETAFSRRTKAAMPNITDRDVILKRKLGMEITTSGAIVSENIARYTFAEDDELLIVEPDIFFCVDSNATGLTQTILARIGYTVQKINQVDRLSLLTQSLV